MSSGASRFIPAHLLEKVVEKFVDFFENRRSKDAIFRLDRERKRWYVLERVSIFVIKAKRSVSFVSKVSKWSTGDRGLLGDVEEFRIHVGHELRLNKRHGREHFKVPANGRVLYGDL